LLLTLFLPWYQESAFESSRGRPVPVTLSVTGWGAFSFVEAAVVLVAVSVLILLFVRGEGRAFHLPGGDGLAIMLAGGWTCFLIAWRMLDKSGTTSAGRVLGVTGIEWGIFIALGVAGLQTYAGTRIRAANRPEPPLPTEEGAVFDGHWHTAEEIRTSARMPAGMPDPVRTQEATVISARARASRSSWRPADHPEWSEAEPQVAWLRTGRSGARYTEHGDEAATEATQLDRRPQQDDDDGQLTIPLGDGH
jgi:hypothetical protein